MVGYLVNLLLCHKEENGLLSTHREMIAPLHRSMKVSEGNLPASLSPLFFQSLSSGVKHDTGCSKTAQTRRERKSLLQFSFSHLAFLGRPPWLIWKYMFKDPSPKGKSGVTSWADTPQWQQEPEDWWGEGWRYLSFPARKPPSFESSKAKKVINKNYRQAFRSSVCKTHTCVKGTNSTWQFCVIDQ